MLIISAYESMQAQTIALRFPDTTMVAGSIVDIPVYADSSLTGKNIISYNLQMTYNSNYFQPIEIIIAGSLSTTFNNLTVNTSIPGTITITNYGTTPLTGKGKLLFIRFAALNAGSFYLNFTGAAFNYFNEGSPLMSFKNGLMNISALPVITVSPDIATITRGDQLQFSATGGTAPYQWFVTNPGIATINATGLLTANQPGFTKVVSQSNNGIRDTSNLIEIRAMQLSIPLNLTQWQGNDIIVPVNVSDLSGLNIYSGSFSVSFNQNILTPIDIIQTGTLLSSYSLPTYNTNNPGNFSMVFYGTTPLAGSGTLIFIKFHVAEQNTGTTSISILNGLFNETLIPTSVNGSFSVINLPNLSLTPNTGSMVAGENQQFTIIGGGIPPFSWSVNDTSAASITQNGLMTAKRSGIVNVTMRDSVGATAISGNFMLYDTRVTMPDTAVCPSAAIFYYPLQINALPSGESIISVQGTITYNSNYLSFIDIETSSTLTQGWTYTKNSTTGQIIFAGYGSAPFNGTGNILKLKFSLNPAFIIGSNAAISLNNLMLNEGFPLPLVDVYGYVLGSNPRPAGNITGSNNVYQGQSGVAYSISPIIGATGYVWTLPAGAVIVSGNNTNSITVNYSNAAVSGNISAYGISDCGSGTATTLAITVLAVPLTSTFTASISNAWENAANWDHGLPGAITNAIIQSTKLAIVNSNNLQCNNLSIAPLGKLTINTNKNLLLNGTLTLQSDTSGTASLINNGTLNTAGNIIQRYITVNSTDEFHQLSSPVANQSISNGFSPSTESFYAWNEGNDSWIPFENPAFVGLNGSNNFVPGRGYAVTYPTTSTKNFSGNLNNASINTLLTLTGGIYSGWNFVGNPYPSSINWNATAGFSRNMLTDAGSGERAYWVWNPVIGNYGSFISNGNSGTNGVSNFIASMQGFWVKAATSGTFSVNNASCEHGSQAWLKTTTAANNSIHLIATTTENSYSDEMIINFGNLNDEGGAEKMFSLYQDAPGLYSTKLNKKWSIDNLASVAANPTIPIGFKAGVDGNYKISVNYDHSLGTIVLEDLKTAAFQNMTFNADYAFYGQQNDNQNRFLLHLSATGIKEYNTESPDIFYANQSFTIFNPWNGKTILNIYDVSGKLLQSSAVKKGIAVYHFKTSQGVYVFKLINENQIFVQKLIVY